ncbi:DUF2975 domain-containing protein [Sphaerisporangium aureirubrum]|uniref:DUF2975 domain-containing protein n=1 Tax=Sphaerisporangium aureirubrum TaxID=1544736 RepID=A0ABW1NL39_9ACTN
MRTERHRYAGPGLIRPLAAVTLWIGIVGAGWGVAYAINGATQAPAYVTVPVALSGFVGPELADPPVRLPDGVLLRPGSGAAELQAWDSTIPEQLLSRGDTAVTGLCLGFGALLLHGLLTSVLRGEPFEAGNPRRVAGLAALVAFAGLVGEALPHVAASMVLGRLRLDPSHLVGMPIPFVPVGVALLLLVLAEAFRQGGRLAGDAAGTV